MIKSFLDDNGLNSQSISVSELTQLLANDMEDALAGNHKSGLVMARSWLGEPRNGTQGRVLAIDAGGTNLRAAVLVFSSGGAFSVENRLHRRMPGFGQRLSMDEFLDSLHSFLSPLSTQELPLGICLAYPMKALPNGEVNILGFCKEIDIELPSNFPLVSAIRRQVWPTQNQLPIRALNDTSGVLLAGNSEIGFILGTGINVATFLPVGNERDIVSLEVQRWNNFRASVFDFEFDKQSLTPGDSPFEKAVSGAYLGPLFHHIVGKAMGSGHFSVSCALQWKDIDTLGTVELDAFLRDPKNLSSSRLAQVFSSQPDFNVAEEIASQLRDRAAKFSASVILACLDPRWGKRNENTVSIEGSTWSRFHRLSSLCKNYIQAENASGNPVIFREITDGSLAGAGKAGLLNVSNSVDSIDVADMAGTRSEESLSTG